jgi:hypothetical protein
MMTHAHNPSTWGADAGGLGVQGSFVNQSKPNQTKTKRQEAGKGEF